MDWDYCRRVIGTLNFYRVGKMIDVLCEEGCRGANGYGGLVRITFNNTQICIGMTGGISESRVLAKTVL